MKYQNDGRNLLFEIPKISFYWPISLENSGKYLAYSIFQNALNLPTVCLSLKRNQHSMLIWGDLSDIPDKNRLIFKDSVDEID